MSDLATDMDETIAELQRRLDEIVALVEDSVDINEHGGPNLAMKIFTVATGQDKP